MARTQTNERACVPVCALFLPRSSCRISSHTRGLLMCASVCDSREELTERAAIAHSGRSKRFFLSLSLTLCLHTTTPFVKVNAECGTFNTSTHVRSLLLLMRCLTDINNISRWYLRPHAEMILQVLEANIALFAIKKYLIASKPNFFRCIYRGISAVTR